MQAASKLVRVGVIGCGRIAQRRHLPLLGAMRDVEIVALADVDPEPLRVAGDRHGVDRRYTNADALVADDSIDAVIVSTPPGAHFEPASAALERGRHLFVESPMALSVQHCDRLIEQASRASLVATVGLNLRQHPMIQRAKRCVSEGWIGPVQAISSTFTTPSRGQRSDKFPTWRVPDILDGSVFAECAVEFFDAWRDLTGEDLVEISVQCTSKGGPVSVSATMGGKVVVGAVFSEYSGDNSEMRLIGREGTLGLCHYRFNGFEYCPPLVGYGSPRQVLRRALETARALPRGLRLAPAGGEYSETFRAQLRSFVEAIRGGAPPLVSLEDGRASAIATLAAFRSMETGRAVALSEIVAESSAMERSGSA